MSKFIIITTINDPLPAIKKFSKWKNWQLVVVGDRKTPENWNYPNVIYLDIDKQAKLSKKLSLLLSENTYVRKLFGYIYAMKNGATEIFESDDDNIPYANAEKEIEKVLTTKTYDLSAISVENEWINIYKLFSSQDVWPRGFPLEYILNDESKKITIEKNNLDWLVMQFLADKDPDVDAIYRLTNNKKVIFNKIKPHVLKPYNLSPTNSQATLWRKESFPLMFFPLGVSDRITDILRGYIVLMCLWKLNFTLGFASPIVYQERNFHNFLSDLNLEFPLYINTSRWIEILKEINGNTFEELFISALKLLVKHSVISENNMHAYEVFLAECDLR